MGNMAEEINDVDIVISSLSEIHKDTAVPRNVRTKVEIVINTLKEGSELPVKVNKALNEIDEIANDVNLQSYTRAQIWNAMSILEKILAN